MKSPEHNIEPSVIEKVGLQPATKPVNASIAPDARVFRYPHLDNVFIMESDLYGNPMPKGSCFLAFEGKRGLIGRHLPVQTLAAASVEDIKALIQAHANA